MPDRKIMEDLLLQTKGACDLYMHGAVESATANVHQTFVDALNQSIAIQNQIYDKMAQHGWYPPEQADQKKLEQIKQQYASAYETNQAKY